MGLGGVAGVEVDIDPEAIATAIFDFFDQERIDTFKAGLRDVKKSFSWEIFTDRLLDPSKIKVAV